jgi:catechol 2,3-dioxygenase-like lactoylglutathione lyase family enzyme
MKVRKHVGMLYVAGLIVFALAAGTLVAQLPPGNASGVSTGHIHLTVPNQEEHREIWMTLGATAGPGPLPLLQFPGMFILLTEGEPGVPSTQTTANHIGFVVQSFEDIHAKLEEVGATFGFENAETGQLLADLPGGVRVEMQQEDGLANPIEFHHIHLSVDGPEELRDWYVEAFGAEVSSRRNLPSAVVPGGRVDFLGARGGPPMPSRGNAIDHIGFEVDDMDAFAAHMAEMGVEFDGAPRTIGQFGLTIAFITDPAGTYIEITEGLGDE